MRMLRLPDVMVKTGLARSTLYRYVSAGKFPKPVHLGERTIAWVESEIDEWLKSKIDERDLRK